MERQESTSSSISLNSWGSDVGHTCFANRTGCSCCYPGDHQVERGEEDLASSFNFTSCGSSGPFDIRCHHHHHHQDHQKGPHSCRHPISDQSMIMQEGCFLQDPLPCPIYAQTDDGHGCTAHLSSCINKLHIRDATVGSSKYDEHLADQNCPPSMPGLHYPHCDSVEVSLPVKLPNLYSHHENEWSNLMMMMKERFAKLLLGEDFSGGSRGASTALTISNAIAKLSAAIFGDLWRLEPLCQDSKLRWLREMEWLASPCDYIVELVPTSQALPSGATIEVMASKPRADVYIGLPALQKLDSMLIEILDRFRDTEFWYAESVQESPSREMACDFPECKVWVPVAKVPSCGLSENARKQLSYQRESAFQILKAAKSINEHVLSEMDIPASYLKALPKSGKKVIGDSPLKVVTSELCCFRTLLSAVENPSFESLSTLANGLESLVHIWKGKINSRLSHIGDNACRATATWGMTKDTSIKKLERKKKYVERAQSLLMELRQRFPGLLQTSLELSKIQNNKDVGCAVLESYSRVLVKLAARIQARIEEVLAADRDAVLSQIQSTDHSGEKQPDADEADVEGPLTSPGSVADFACKHSNDMEPEGGHHDNSCSCCTARTSSSDSLLHLGLQLEMLLGNVKLPKH